MHEHPDLSSGLLHHRALRRSRESPLRHQIEKQRRVLAPGVGEQGFATRREELRYEVCEGRNAPPLVEHVGGEEEIEGPEALRRVPVEERGPWLPAQVRPGVVDRVVEGCFVVVRRENLRPARQGYDAGKPDAASELDGSPAREVLAREVPREGDRARPELGPVRETLVPLEVLLVYEGVGRGGMENAVSLFPDLDGGFEEPGTAAEVLP